MGRDSKLDKESLFFERLDEKHLPMLGSFRCREKDLENFLIEDALRNQQQGISVTYLWFLKADRRLVGYVSILTDSINLNADLKVVFREKDIDYRYLPALKIGRIAVREDMMRRGIGSMMIRFSVAVAHKIADEMAGCRFVVLDSKRSRDPAYDPIHFYKKMGFGTLTDRRRGALPMYLDTYFKETD